MKLLILFFLISSAYANLSKMSVDSELHTLLHRAYSECKYDFEDWGKPSLSNIINVSGEKACDVKLQTLEDELLKYKQELQAEIDYRNLLIEKKATAKTAYEAVKDKYHTAAQKAGIAHVSNPDAWYRDNCDQVSKHEQVDACIVRLQSLTAKIPEIQAEIVAQKDKEQTCKGYKGTTLAQFELLSDKAKLTLLFNILKCGM